MPSCRRWEIKHAHSPVKNFSLILGGSSVLKGFGITGSDQGLGFGFSGIGGWGYIRLSAVRLRIRIGICPMHTLHDRQEQVLK